MLPDDAPDADSSTSRAQGKRGKGQPSKAKSGPSLMARALGLLSRREHTRQELRRKLARYVEASAHMQGDAETPTPDPLDPVFDRLEALGYLNEARAVEAVVRQQADQMGVARLQQTLLRKGVNAEQAREALVDLAGSEQARAQALWARRFGAQLPQDRSAWNRQARFLLGRGFSGEVVRRVLPAMPSLPVAVPAAARTSFSRTSMRTPLESTATPDAEGGDDGDGWVRSSRQRASLPARKGWSRRSPQREVQPRNDSSDLSEPDF